MNGTINPDQPKPEATPIMLGWLSNLNNLLAAVGVAVATIAAILSNINKEKIAQVDRDVKRLEFREKTEKSSHEFAKLFLEKVIPDAKLKDHPKNVQAMLSVLNIVAQASSSKEGESDPKTRGMTPVTLALLLGEPGGVAAMDATYEYLDNWVAIACADNSHQTRITAIQALVGICQKALRERRLDILAKGVEAIEQLFVLLPLEESSTSRSEAATMRDTATAARTQLAFFLKKEAKLLAAAKLPNGVPGDESTIRSDIQNAFPDVALVAQERAEKLRAVLPQLEQSNQANVRQQANKVKETLAQLDAALVTASQVTVEAGASTQIAVSGQPDKGLPPPIGVQPESTESSIARLIQELANQDDQTRRRTRSQLALFGQRAVEPLLKEIENRFGKNSEEDDKTRLGVATALKLMHQPIELNATQAYWTVTLLGSSDAETRVLTADFLMDLWTGSTIRKVYAELEKIVSPYLGTNSVAPGKLEGHAVYNAACIVATWARVLHDSVRSPEEDKPMNAFCHAKAKEWKQKLEASQRQGEWKKTTEMLGKLIQQADTKAAKKQSVVEITESPAM